MLSALAEADDMLIDDGHSDFNDTRRRIESTVPILSDEICGQFTRALGNYIMTGAYRMISSRVSITMATVRRLGTQAGRRLCPCLACAAHRAQNSTAQTTDFIREARFIRTGFPL